MKTVQPRKEQITCEHCHMRITPSEVYSTRFVHTGPWHDDLYIYHFCSKSCEDNYNSNYSHCHKCGCDILANMGYLHYSHMLNERLICIGCYKQEILKNGQPITDFETPTLNGGAFFGFNNPEPKAAGFSEVVTVQLYSETSIEKYNKSVKNLIEQGYDVITCFERLSLGEGGTFTLMVRRRNK